MANMAHRGQTFPLWSDLSKGLATCPSFCFYRDFYTRWLSVNQVPLISTTWKLRTLISHWSSEGALISLAIEQHWNTLFFCLKQYIYNLQILFDSVLDIWSFWDKEETLWHLKEKSINTKHRSPLPTDPVWTVMWPLTIRPAGNWHICFLFAAHPHIKQCHTIYKKKNP